MKDQTITIEQTRIFARSFHYAMSRQCNLTIVSPFITGFKPWNSILEFARFFIQRQSRPFTLITRPPVSADSVLSPSEAIGLAAMGIDLKIRNQPTLHSKIYLFEFDEGDYTAFIGSANLTRGGFERNDETVAKFRSANEKSEILAEIKRLNGLGAFPFEHWRSMNPRGFDEGVIV